MLSVLRHRAYKRAVILRLSGSSADCAVPAGGKVEKILLRALFALMGMLSKCDGRVTRAEIDYATSVMHILDLGPRQRQEAIDFFHLGKEREANVLVYVDELAACIGRSSELARLFMRVQLRLVYCKGGMRLKEKMLLQEVAEALGFDKPAFQQMCPRRDENRPGNQGPASWRSGELQIKAYQILGLTSGAADSEIRPAYLRLMTRYHPDKLEQTGLSTDALRKTQNRAAEIRAAYEEICKSRKLRP